MIDADIHRDSAKGDVTIENGRIRVVFQRTYRKPIEKVWAALTIPERLEDWLAPPRSICGTAAPSCSPIPMAFRPR